MIYIILVWILSCVVSVGKIALIKESDCEMWYMLERWKCGVSLEIVWLCVSVSNITQGK